MELGYVFMEDLARAVAQFYPSSSGGMSGLGGSINLLPQRGLCLYFTKTKISLVLQLQKGRVGLSGILAVNCVILSHYAKISP